MEIEGVVKGNGISANQVLHILGYGDCLIEEMVTEENEVHKPEKEAHVRGNLKVAKGEKN